MDTDKTIRRALIAAKSIASSVGVGARPGFAAGGDAGAGDQAGVFDEPKERRLNSLGMYSAAAEAARALPQKMGTAQQMVASLKGVKPDELDNAKVFSRWQPNDKISKEELAQHFEGSFPPIDKTQLSGDSSRFHQYSTKGGENYKETLLRYKAYGAPDGGLRYDSPHWPGSPNTLVHYRTSDRPNASPIRKPRLPRTDTTVSLSRGRSVRGDQEQGAVVPGWETVSPGLVAHRAYKRPENGIVLTHRQSGLSLASFLDLEGAHALANDLHALTPHWDSMSYEDLQATPAEFKARVREASAARRIESRHRESAPKEAQAKVAPRALLLDELQSDWAQQGRENGAEKVPPAPYIDSTPKWTDLGLKSVLHEAAIGGHSHLVWTPGEKQVDRYNLSKHIDRLHWVTPMGSDNLGVLHALKGDRYILASKMKPDEIHKHVGKELAERLLSQPENARGIRGLSGNDLSVGGHGMKGYYDNILPKRILALAREHDPEAKISPYKSKDKHVNGFPAVEITPRMRKSILAGGFKSFARGGSVVLDPKERAANLGKFMEGSHITSKWDPDSGSPRRLYHATPKSFRTFKKGDNPTDFTGNTSGPVIFMTDSADAQHAGHNIGGYQGQYKEGTNVMPLYASIKNPLYIDELNKEKEQERLGLGRGWPYLFTHDDVSKLRAAGHDGVVHFKLDDSHPTEVIAFDSSQVKSAVGNNGNFDPRERETTKAGGGSVILDPKERAANLGKFMEGSHPETFEDGSPKVLHHGTLSEFNAFGRGSVMADHGAGIYMTDTPEDATNNYASIGGADQHAKIQLAEERLLDHPEFEHGPVNAGRLRNAARKELGHANDGLHLPLHVSMQNPVVIGGDNHTKFTYEEPYNPDTEEYGEPSGSLVNLIGGIQKTAAEMGLRKRHEDALISALHEHAIDGGGIDARDAEEFIKLYGQVDDDDNDGHAANNEFWRRSLENAGHDGIIDHDVYKKFRMQNTHPGTTHYIAFRPEQVKSAIGNNGRYDRSKKDLTKASGGAVGSGVDHAPTEAQKIAGNYRKGHIVLHGLCISIENRKGSRRSGKDPNGKKWSCVLPADYGYIKRTQGADGDHVDCYIGPHPESKLAFIINQRDAGTKKFDEHKVMLGYASEAQALRDYVKSFSDGKGSQRMGGMKTVSVDALRHWLKTGNTKAEADHDEIVGRALKIVDGSGK